MIRRFKLDPWHGVTPTALDEDDRHAGYVIGRIDADPEPFRASARVPLGDAWCGLWGSDGKLVVGVEGTQLMAFIPGRDEVALVRQEASRPKWRCESSFERWSLDGKRRSRLVLDAKLPMGNLATMTFAKKHGGRIVKVASADEDGRYAFFVEIGEPDPDRAAPTLAELAGKVVLVAPAKRAANLFTPAHELADLANQSVALAVDVAKNCAAPPSLLAKLAKHDDARVRAAAATNGGLAIADQKKLARDPDVNAKIALFSMRNVYDTDHGGFRRTRIDASVAAILAKDSDPRVRAAYVKAYGDFGAGAVDLAREPLAVRLAAVRWGISIERERDLARDSSAEVRLKLAVTRHPRKCGRSPSIDAEALKLLQNDSSKRVREAAAALQAYPRGTTKPPT